MYIGYRICFFSVVILLCTAYVMCPRACVYIVFMWLAIRRALCTRVRMYKTAVPFQLLHFISIFAGLLYLYILHIYIFILYVHSVDRYIHFYPYPPIIIIVIAFIHIYDSAYLSTSVCRCWRQQNRNTVRVIVSCVACLGQLAGRNVLMVQCSCVWSCRSAILHCCTLV